MQSVWLFTVQQLVYCLLTTTTTTTATGTSDSLANCDSCPTPAKSEGIEYLQVGPTEIKYSIAWTIFVYLQRGQRKPWSYNRLEAA